MTDDSVAPTISSDTLQAGTSGALNRAYWSAETLSGDQHAQASLPDSSSTHIRAGMSS